MDSMQIFVKSISGKTLSISTSASSSISSIKLKIFEKEGLQPIEEQLLLYAGKFLDRNNLTLSDYGSIILIIVHYYWVIHFIVITIMLSYLTILKTLLKYRCIFFFFFFFHQLPFLLKLKHCLCICRCLQQFHALYDWSLTGRKRLLSAC